MHQPRTRERSEHDPLCACRRSFTVHVQTARFHRDSIARPLPAPHVADVEKGDTAHEIAWEPGVATARRRENSTSAGDQLRDAAELTEEIARGIFGPAAYLKTLPYRDRETGDEGTMFEVHYGFERAEEDFERLVELHTAFTNTFSARLGPEVLDRIVLAVVPTDDDSSTASAGSP